MMKIVRCSVYCWVEVGDDDDIDKYKDNDNNNGKDNDNDNGMIKF